MVPNLHFLLRPRSIVLVGASSRPQAVGGIALRNLVQGGFRGALTAVDPELRAPAGVAVYRDIAELPETPDLALICTPPDSLAGVVDALGKRGTRAAVILTSCVHSSTDPNESSLQRKLLHAAKAHRLRVLGPDSIGLLVPELALNASLARVAAQPGQIAFVSQSGALTSAALGWAAARAIGFSYVVSLGDAADIDAADIVEYLGADPGTRAILLYIESISGARKFLSAARAASRAKPVIVFKSGRTAAGARAVIHHTGRDPGDDRVFEAAMRRAGMLRVQTIAELFAAAETIARVRADEGDRLIVVTNAGGPAVVATDALIAGGGALATLAAETATGLHALLPAAASESNPVDLGGDASPKRYADALRTVQAEPQRNALLVIHGPSSAASARNVAQACAGVLRESQRHVLACWMGGARGDGSAARTLRAAGIPVYETPESAVQAFLHMSEYWRNQEALQETPSSALLDFEPDAAAARKLLQRVLGEGRSHLREPEGKALLHAYGIPVVDTRFAASGDAAVGLAREIGYPVALKVVSPEVAHRADVGGVMLDLENDDEVRRAATEIARRLQQFRPGAALSGFTVQRMIRRPGAVHSPHGALELTLSASEDPVFGPVVLLGSPAGNCAIGLVPLNAALAHDMLLRCSLAREAGEGSRAPIDIEATTAAIVRMSQLLADHPEVVALAIDPLLADDSGVMALEVRTRVAPAKLEGSGRLAILPYPRHLERRVELDWGSLLVRPIRPEDARRYSEFIGRIGEQDLRRRFAGSAGLLTSRDLARSTQIDYDRDMAFVAVSQSGQSQGEILGEIRAYRYPEGATAELGVIVRSDMKRRGLGRVLMAALIDYTRANGLELIGQIARDNAAMIGLAERCGMQVDRPAGTGIAVAHLPPPARPVEVVRGESDSAR